MALSQFMPYGAPELIAGERERMARATFGSSMLFALAFTALWLVATHLPPPAARVERIEIHVLEPPPPLAEAAPPGHYVPPAPAARSSLHDIPVPVADRDAPIAPVETVARPGAGGAEGTPSDDLRIAPPEPVAGAGADPDPTAPAFVDEYPELIRCAAVVYPDLAREAGVEGRVLVLILVGKDGRAQEVRADPKHTVPMLEAAALESARSCVFKPALTNGHAVAVWVARPYEFHLR